MNSANLDGLYEWQERERAWQAAEFRKLSPESFDAEGNILKGELPKVLARFAEHHPNRALR